MANTADFIAHLLGLMQAAAGIRTAVSEQTGQVRDAELSTGRGRAPGRALRASACARPMFGGHGLYVDGTIVAIVIDDVVYCKTDDQNRSEFTALGLEPFVYATRATTKTVMGYHRAPDEALENPLAMAHWLRSALGAALRSAGPKRKRASPDMDGGSKPNAKRKPARRAVKC